MNSVPKLLINILGSTFLLILYSLNIFVTVVILLEMPVNTDIEGARESVRINKVSILNGLNLEKMKGISLSGS